MPLIYSTVPQLTGQYLIWNPIFAFWLTLTIFFFFFLIYLFISVFCRWVFFEEVIANSSEISFLFVYFVVIFGKVIYCISIEFTYCLFYHVPYTFCFCYWTKFANIIFPTFTFTIFCFLSKSSELFKLNRFSVVGSFSKSLNDFHLSLIAFLGSSLNQSLSFKFCSLECISLLWKPGFLWTVLSSL